MSGCGSSTGAKPSAAGPSTGTTGSGAVAGTAAAPVKGKPPCPCTVTATPKPISICGTTQTATLTATGTPAGGSFSWSSSDAGIANVSGAGNSATVQPVSPGTATIKVAYTVSGCGPCSDAVPVTVAAPDVFVTEITFQGVKDIYYARIPTPGPVSFLLPAPADAAPAHKHFKPVEIRPAAGSPHWKKKAGATPNAELSWPAAYVRTGVGAPPPRLKASFEIPSAACHSAVAKIKATSSQGVTIAEKTLTFAGGKASDTFDLQNLPSTVQRFDGIEFTWTFEIDSHACASRVTKHTLFVVDEVPKRANLHTKNEDKFLWEIFEWSCKWANGTTGHQDVLDAIWAQFSPVKAAHNTGLIYWKEYLKLGGQCFNQALVTAIQSREDPRDAVQNGASCIVFDEILMNCLAAQGISSAEVTLDIPGGPFNRLGATYVCDFWNDDNTRGQGNFSAPPGWESHWIAAVSVPVLPSLRFLDWSHWKLYDASYGEIADANCAAPASAAPGSAAPGSKDSTIDIQSYEPKTVASFHCSRVSPPPVKEEPAMARNPDPAVPPHLTGKILWTNK